MALLAGQVARAADVDITTSTNDGVNLNTYSGTTAQVESGVTVTDNTFANTCGAAGVCASTSAWSLTNLGTIGSTSTFDGVDLTAGGSVVNFGMTTGAINGIYISGAPGSVDNRLGATITGGQPISIQSGGTVINAGTISGTGQGVGLSGGGTLTNLATGQIIAQGGTNGVGIVGGSSRVVNNYGLIQGGDDIFAAGVAVTGTVNNYSGGQITAGYNGIWSPGSSTISNDGLIAATAADSGGAAIDARGGTIINTGTVRSTASDASDAGILMRNAGSITNTGTIESLDGGLAVLFTDSHAHTLNLGTGSVLTGNVQGGSGTDNLVLQGTGTESLSKFLNFETLAMQGTDWTLTGSGTFATSAEIDTGRLAVNGTLTTSNLSILSGGVLGGGGSILGAVTNGGTIAPGNSIGTLTASSVLFSPNSLYSVEIDPTSADKLVVTGTATIDPTAKVEVTAANGTYTNGTSYPILTAGTLSATFGGVIDTSPFLDFTLDYAHLPNQVWLTVTVADFASVAETPNQKAAAGGAQGQGAGNSVYDAILPLDASTAQAAFDLLSGEIYASAKGALLDQSRLIREATLGRLGDGLEPAPSATAPLAYAAPGATTAKVPWPDAKGSDRFAAWAQVFGSGASLSGDGNAAGLDRQVGGFFAGGDWTGPGGWRLGVATGVDITSLDEPARASTASAGGSHLAVYGGYDGGALKARAGAAVAWQEIATRRTVAFPGFTDTLTADYGARTEQVFGEVATPVRLGNAVLEPYAGAAWVGVDVDAFTEQGGAAALSSPSSHLSTALTTLGLRFNKPVDLGTATQLSGGVAWQHAFGGLAPTSDLAFAGGVPFTVAGTPRAADVLKLDLGLAAALGPGATGKLGYSGEIGDGVGDHALLGRVTVDF